jgi:hypothetical protein
MYGSQLEIGKSRMKRETKAMTIEPEAKTNKMTPRIAGVLYIIGTMGGILSLASKAPVRDAQDYLASVAADGNPMILGALCVLTMGLALAMIPVVMIPVLRRHNETLALGLGTSFPGVGSRLSPILVSRSAGCHWCH